MFHSDNAYNWLYINIDKIEKSYLSITIYLHKKNKNRYFLLDLTLKLIFDPRTIFKLDKQTKYINYLKNSDITPWSAQNRLIECNYLSLF